MAAVKKEYEIIDNLNNKQNRVHQINKPVTEILHRMVKQPFPPVIWLAILPLINMDNQNIVTMTQLLSYELQ